MDAVDLPIGDLLAGEHAFVTGAARGIGRAVALHLARGGAVADGAPAARLLDAIAEDE